MAVDFSQVSSVTIPEGTVSSIAINGTTVWSASRYQSLDYICRTGTVANQLDTGIQGTAGTWTVTMRLTGASGTLGIFGVSAAAGWYVGTTSGQYWGGGGSGSGVYISSSDVTTKTTITGIRFYKSGSYFRIIGYIGTRSFTRSSDDSSALTGNAKFLLTTSKSYGLYLYGVSCVDSNGDYLINASPVYDSLTSTYGLYDSVSETFIAATNWSGGND